MFNISKIKIDEVGDWSCMAKMMVFHEAHGKQLVYYELDRKLPSLSSASRKTTVQ